MEIQAKLYQELKAKGAVRPVKITENTFAVAIRQFGQFDGQPLEEKIEQVNLSELEAERAATAAKLAGLDAMIADFKAL